MIFFLLFDFCVKSFLTLSESVNLLLGIRLSALENFEANHAEYWGQVFHKYEKYMKY